MAISTGCLELAESSVDSKKRYTHYSNFYGADGATAAVWIVVETLWKLKWKRKAKIRSYFFLSLCFPRDSVLPYKNRSFLQSSFLCSSIFDRHETFPPLFLQDTAFAIPFYISIIVSLTFQRWNSLVDAEMSQKPIFVVTHPRACSTAFERVFIPLLYLVFTVMMLTISGFHDPTE